MHFFLIMAFLFFIGSLLGWGLEVLFRRFFSGTNPERRWINPGFLIGPYLPLYGFSLCVLYLLASLEPLLPIASPALRKLTLFMLMSVCVTLVEYITGKIFIIGMNVKLWDYTGLWGNIEGIICPLFSFFWAILSAAYYFLIHPHVLTALVWLSQNLSFSFCIGFFFGVFAIDFAYSAQLLAKIRRFAASHEIVIKYEELRAHLRRKREESLEKAHFFLSLHTPTPISEQLSEFHDTLMRLGALTRQKKRRH